MKEYYKILNVASDATDEEIEQSYRQLKEKYSNDRFLEGEAGNQAAKNLTKLETAYQEIITARKNVINNGENMSYDFSEVEKNIRQNNLNLAQDLLDNFNDRNAEWHYLQSVIFYKKNWINESKKQLEIAMNMEPHNTKYSDSYTKLNQKIEFNNRQFYSGNAQYGAGYQDQPRQMGGTDNSCLTFCATWCCMDMLCSCCCR